MAAPSPTYNRKYQDFEIPSWDTCFCELAQIGPFVYDFWSFL